MWNFSLTANSYKLYAIAHYKNGKSYWNEFFMDLKMLHSVPKLLAHRVEKQQKVTGVLNTIIRLGNSFGKDSLGRLLLVLTPLEYLSDLKTILLYISRMPETIPELDVSEIAINIELYKELENL